MTSDELVYAADRRAAANNEITEADLPYEDTHESPKGEETEVAYIGKTRLFSEHQNQVALGMAGYRAPKAGFLKHHVPLDMRGNYKVVNPQLEERIHPTGYALCKATTQTHDSRGERIRAEGAPCKGKAINRSGYCSRHGGMLHPLDRKRVKWEEVPRELRFKFGRLPVEDLDDEELARGQIRREDGTWTKSKYLHPDVHKRMMQELFNRADVKLRESLVDVVDVMVGIAKSDAFEPADRAAAARWVYETVRGKTPQKVEVDVTPRFEQVLNATLQGGSRAESRRARGIEDIEGEILDVESEAMGDLDTGDDKVEKEDVYEYEPEPAYHTEEARTVGQDLEPKPVIHYGPASIPTTDIPPDDAGRYAHHVRVDEHAAESVVARREFAKKKKLPEQIAEERKAHKEKMRKGIAKRKAFVAMGENTLPKVIMTHMRVWDKDGDEIEVDDDYSPEPGDEAVFYVDKDYL